MWNQIDYRMNLIMRAASIYKDHLGLQEPDCADVDMENFPSLGFASEIRRLLRNKYQLFDDPSCHQGDIYDKGHHTSRHVFRVLGGPLRKQSNSD